ncbi:MAG: S8 family peptidase [Bacteroidales bacterium]|nr:S8 family peptidase [Bacteroidales bacterium]
MKRLIFLCLLFGLAISLFGQNPAPTSYRVYLSDKNNSPYSINNPSEYLSQRAIDKRIRFNIPFTEQDFPINPQYKQQILALDPQMQPLAVSKWMNTFVVYCPDSAIIPQILNLPFVDSVMAVAAYHLKDSLVAEPVPENPTPMVCNTPTFSKDTLDYGFGFAQIALHNGHLLHAEGFHGEGMLIAVIDGGFGLIEDMPFFQEIVNSGRFLGKYSLLPNLDSLSSGGAVAESGHGTDVTSAMAANIPGELIGTAPAASYVFIMSEVVGTEQLIEEDFWVNGAEIADSIGADVVNSSLGYRGFPDFPQASIGYEQMDGVWSIASRAATILGQKGVVVCVSAGNSGNYIGHPADAFDILSVGATSDSVILAFSSHGPTYDGRVKPDVVAEGENVYCYSIAPPHYHSGSYWLIPTGGTSMASPIIAGLSACLWQAMPCYTSSQIMRIIRESGHFYNNPNPDYGYGIPDFHKAYTTHVGINDYKPQTLSIYPNPVTDQLNILNPQFNIQAVSVYNAAGQLVLQTAVPNSPILKIPVTNLPSGFYVGKATFDNHQMVTFKFLKQ